MEYPPGEGPVGHGTARQPRGTERRAAAGPIGPRGSQLECKFQAFRLGRNRGQRLSLTGRPASSRPRDIWCPETCFTNQCCVAHECSLEFWRETARLERVARFPSISKTFILSFTAAPSFHPALYNLLYKYIPSMPEFQPFSFGQAFAAPFSVFFFEQNPRSAAQKSRPHLILMTGDPCQFKPADSGAKKIGRRKKV